MLDGQETVEIVYGELRWEEARQHAGRRGNSFRKASLGGSETACWTEIETVQIACGKLRWEGVRQHAGSERACWTERNLCK